MKIKIDEEKVRAIKLDSLIQYLPHYQDEFKEMNNDPYSLYAYISTLFKNKTILDVGSRYGLSALALSYNETNRIISYDLINTIQFDIQKDNIEFKVMDFRNDESLDFNKIPVIMIDVDPHDGVQERAMYSFLHEKQWKGILLLDDISDVWWPHINKWWNEIEYEKYDLTHIGHFSGTGLVNFGGKHVIEVV